MKLLQTMGDGVFSLAIEFTPRSREDVLRIARIAAGLPELNRRLAPHRIAIPALVLTQSPGGNRSLDLLGALAILRAEGLPPEVEVIPHVTGRDTNADALAVLLKALVESGVETILALTGDLPAGRGVSEPDSPGVLRLVRETNAAMLRTARSIEDLASRPQLTAGAVVSPFECAPDSPDMQWVRATGMVREGAAFLVCQAGWDAERSERLIGELRRQDVPVLGNARVVNEADARHMQTLPGCVVTAAFLNRLRGEGEAANRARAAQQIAMFRGLGYAGADLGKPGDFQSLDEIAEIVEGAAAIANWRVHRENLVFAPPPPGGKPAGASSAPDRAFVCQPRTNPLAGSGLIQVAELIHASIPLAGAALKFTHRLGPAGFDKPNRGRSVIEDLIRTQAAEGADYIDLNLDALGAADAPGTMRRLVRLVRDHGDGTPPCVDSSDPAVLEAGLDEWLSFGPDLRPPLVNSVTLHETERYDGILARRRERVFGIVGLLIGSEGPLRTADEMVEGARRIFARCVAAGFLPGDLLFDTVTMGISTDGFLDAEGNMKNSHTRNSFQAIRRIRDDATMKGVHALLGVSNWVYGARKRRIGHLRAFVEVAREYGLDAAIVDTSQSFGLRAAPPELVEFVRMYAALDGTEASMDLYTEGIARARANEWV